MNKNKSKKKICILEIQGQWGSDCISHFLNKYKLKHFLYFMSRTTDVFSSNTTVMIVYQWGKLGQ